MDAIRFAVVGCGNIAEGYHLPALAALDGGAFVVACDIEKERAARVAGKFGAREWGGDYPEIVARDDVDLVCIFTKIDTHAEIAMAAADAGKHVFVQKPLAPTLRRGRAMADAARANGTQLVTSFMHSYFPESLAAAELIRAGRIGRIEHIRQRNATRNPLASAPSYGGALMDIGAHGIALIQALSGQDIVRVAARIEGEEASADGNGAPEDRRLQGDEVNAWLLYELSGGATASHEVQWSQPGRHVAVPGGDLRLRGLAPPARTAHRRTARHDLSFGSDRRLETGPRMDPSGRARHPHRHRAPPGAPGPQTQRLGRAAGAGGVERPRGVRSGAPVGGDGRLGGAVGGVLNGS